MSPIPEFKQSGVLPGCVGSPPDYTITERWDEDWNRSPYPVTIEEIEEVFGTSAERRRILLGWLEFRAALRATGIPLERGFIWLDGSFCEALEEREPRDLDLVAFLPLPTPDERAAAGWTEEEMERRWFELLAFFDAEQKDQEDEDSVWRRYRCDAYYVLLDLGAEELMQEVIYWYGLFSHRRGTQEWKGMLRIGLGEQHGEAALMERLRIADDAQETT